MTINSSNAKVQYSGDDSTVAFPITFAFWDNTDIKAILTSAAGVETTWVLSTQYTLSGGSGSTGTLTVSTTPTDYTPATGETLTIKSVLPYTQGTSLPKGGDFPTTSVEQQFDKAIRQIQQVKEIADRGITFTETTQTTGVVFPEPSANKYIGWNSAADDLENKAAPNVVSATANTLGVGAAATASFNATTGVLTLGIPTGPQGDTYDTAVTAGFNSLMVAENIAVATYSEWVMARTGSFTGEAGYIDVAPTGDEAIVDILKNGTTIYTTKPQFAIAANTLTAGVLKTDGTEDFVSGDRITFKVTQIGSTEPGEGLRFTVKATITV